MKDLNNWTGTGRLTRDAELKYTNTGYQICNMSIAVNRSVKRNDQWTDDASFFDVVLFGKRAESLTPYLLKGKQIGISGELTQDRWEDKEGKKRSRVQIVAQDIQLIGSKPQQATIASTEQLEGEPDPIDDDDIPF